MKGTRGYTCTVHEMEGGTRRSEEGATAGDVLKEEREATSWPERLLLQELSCEINKAGQWYSEGRRNMKPLATYNG